MAEAFSFLDPYSSLGSVCASWIPRQAGLNVVSDKTESLTRLKECHRRHIRQTFPMAKHLHFAEQIHSCKVVDTSSSLIRTGIASPFPLPGEPSVLHAGTDGLITTKQNQLLGIYVADCAAIYLTDPRNKVIALLHSGRKGTEENILRVAVEIMSRRYGTDPKDIIGILSPCIRPPHYEVDFAATIREQADELGIENFHDSRQNTASNLATSYSYRIEKGRTGRMLALLSLA